MRARPHGRTALYPCPGRLLTTQPELPTHTSCPPAYPASHITLLPAGTNLLPFIYLPHPPPPHLVNTPRKSYRPPSVRAESRLTERVADKLQFKITCLSQLLFVWLHDRCVCGEQAKTNIRPDNSPRLRISLYQMYSHFRV